MVNINKYTMVHNSNIDLDKVNGNGTKNLKFVPQTINSAKSYGIWCSNMKNWK